MVFYLINLFSTRNQTKEYLMKKVLVMMMTLLAIQLIAQTGQIDSDGKKEVKRALSYQSLIKDSLGNPIEDGKYLISFKLYDSENSNDPVWFENQNVYITDGILNVLLGNKKRLEPELFINPLWLTLEMNGEESEKQYVSASSYSMYSGLVDLNAFAPSDDVSFSLAPDGRIIIDVIDSEPVIPSVYGDEWSFYTGGVNNWALHTNDSGEWQRMCVINAMNLYPNVAISDWSKQTIFWENGDFEVNGNIIGKKNMNVTGNLSVAGKLSTSLFSDRNFYTGGTNSWLLHTPDDLDENGNPRQMMCIINSSHLAPNVPVSDWSTQNIFYENGDFQPHSVIKSVNDIKLQPKWNSTGGTVYIGTQDKVNDLRVNGTIFATEIQVKLNVFPDYVFKKDYNLLPLSEVESHINNYGTLPGMPTEKEIVENGLNINQMQIKLVEKIEELTLHMIRLEKENKELKDRLNTIIE